MRKQTLGLAAAVVVSGWVVIPSSSTAQIPVNKICNEASVRSRCEPYFTVCTSYLQPCFTCEPAEGATLFFCEELETAICLEYHQQVTVNCGTKYRGYCFPDGAGFTCHAGSTGEPCAQNTYDDC